MKEIIDEYVALAFDAAPQATFKYVQFERNYRKYFPHNLDAKLLDIGFGRGEMLHCFKSWGYVNGKGVDISPSTVKHCSSLGFDCVLADSVHDWLDNYPEAFDVITMLDVLEHFSKDKVLIVLKSIREALKNDGVFIVQVPNMQSPDAQLHRYNDFTHELGFVEHSLRQVLLASGFKGLSFYGFEEDLETGFALKVKIAIRNLYWRYVRFVRAKTHNINPLILHPVFFAIAKK